MDAGINWDNGVLSFQLDPYVNYFPNYIYMNPTSGYYEGLQLYHYTQSKVLRWGFEATVNWKILDNLEADLKRRVSLCQTTVGREERLHFAVLNSFLHRCQPQVHASARTNQAMRAMCR